MSTNAGLAFVIMPFGQSYDDVYDYLFKPCFEAAGFDVARADEYMDQGNILQRICESIEQATVVLADLTDLNANVLWELGVAHTLNKPVVMVTQDRSSVPFDVGAYRVNQYSMVMPAFEESHADLTELAQAIAADQVAFNNPISAHLPHVCQALDGVVGQGRTQP